MQDIITFFKGRIALYSILKCLGVKHGDEVILPGFTCVVVPNAITYLGAKPVYVDIRPETYNLDPDQIAQSITERTKAIIAQHTFGIPAEMDEIVQIARRHNLFLIEDCAHSLGSRYRGQEVGTFGDAAFFSAQWSKPITTGLGGWAVVNNPELKEKLLSLHSQLLMPNTRETILLQLQYLIYTKIFSPSSFWRVQEAYRFLTHWGVALGSSSNDELASDRPARYEKKMSSWQERFLRLKLESLDRHLDHRKWLTTLYDQYLPDRHRLELPANYDPVLVRYPIQVQDKERVLEEARRQRIEIWDWFLSPVHPKITGWEKVQYEKGMCPVAEEICRHSIGLPTHDRVRKEDVEKISRLVFDS
jgi:perosamine synthetase